MKTIRRRVETSAGDISSAMTKGTTLPTRLFMAIAMMFYSIGFFTNQASWLNNPVFSALNEVIKLRDWGVLYALGGALMLWRVLALKSNIYCAWVINVYVFLIWFSGLIIRIWGIGPVSLASTYTSFFIMAFWLLLRTEATPRDKETS